MGESQERLKTITDSVVEAIITCNTNGTIVDCNKASLKIFGYTQNELIGLQTIKLVPDKYKEHHLRGFEMLSQTGNSPILGRTVDLEAIRKDGTIFPIALSLVSSCMKNEIYYTAVIRDITERKKSENSILQLNEALQIRLKAVEAFNEMVVHDINAPLRSLEGFAQILEEDYINKPLDEVAKQYIHRMRVAVIKMRQLLHDLLRLAEVTRPDTQLTLKEVNLSKMVDDILYEHTMAYPRASPHKFIVQPDVVLNADEDFLKLAIFNLISNAWKFTANVGEALIEFGTYTINGQIVYFIKDNGAGFNSSKADKMFEPFQRLHTQAEFPGNGIGLTIVKRVITLHKGNVWATSGEGSPGATFFFTIGSEHGN